MFSIPLSENSHPKNTSFAMTLSQSLKSHERQAFYESRKDIAKIMILVVFLFPLFGVYISGLLGAAIGMVTSVAAYFLTPYITLKLSA